MSNQLDPRAEARAKIATMASPVMKRYAEWGQKVVVPMAFRWGIGFGGFVMRFRIFRFFIKQIYRDRK